MLLWLSAEGWLNDMTPIKDSVALPASNSWLEISDTYD